MFSAIYEYQKNFLLWKIELHYKLPVDKTHLDVWGGLSNQKVSPSASIRRARWSDATTLDQNRSSYANATDLIQSGKI